MLRKIYAAIVGYVKFRFSPSEKRKLLDHCLSAGIGTIYCSVEGDEGTLCLFRRDANKLTGELACERISEHGLPVLFRQLGHRPGLLVGAVLALLLLLLSSLTVWRIEVTGNETVGDLEIEEALAEAGLSVGDLTATTDVSAVRTRFLRDNPRISWIGIYLRGTTAAVEVRERVDEGGNGEDEAPWLANLVAASDAVIESVSVKRGRAAVEAGMTVKRGELLVSGIYKTADGVICTRAEGEIRGRVEREFRVVQPLLVTEKEVLGRKTVGVSLNFFQKEIKLFNFAGKTEDKYDIIRRKEQVVLFGFLRLPISLSWDDRVTYSERSLSLDEEAAVKAAFSLLNAELASSLSGSELLRKSIVGEFTDEGYVLTCRAEYVTDIAVPLAYEADRNGG